MLTICLAMFCDAQTEKQLSVEDICITGLK